MADFGPAWLAEGAPAVKVFVAFKKEEYQRKVLEKLSTGHLPAFFERTEPASKTAKPACMNMTMAPQTINLSVAPKRAVSGGYLPERRASF